MSQVISAAEFRRQNGMDGDKPKSSASVRGKGRIAQPRAMNKTEARYEDRLRNDPTVAWFAYEAVTLKLGPDCRYTPDFAVMRKTGAIELHEVKGGYSRDDALVKLRAAAGRFPLHFVLAKWDKGAWSITEVLP